MQKVLAGIIMAVFLVGVFIILPIEIAGVKGTVELYAMFLGALLSALAISWAGETLWGNETPEKE
jgi:MFS superfamily sulfate permease-like transporter